MYNSFFCSASASSFWEFQPLLLYGAPAAAMIFRPIFRCRAASRKRTKRTETETESTATPFGRAVVLCSQSQNRGKSGEKYWSKVFPNTHTRTHTHSSCGEVANSPGFCANAKISRAELKSQPSQHCCCCSSTTVCTVKLRLPPCLCWWASACGLSRLSALLLAPHTEPRCQSPVAKLLGLSRHFCCKPDKVVVFLAHFIDIN